MTLENVIATGCANPDCGRSISMAEWTDIERNCGTVGGYPLCSECFPVYEEAAFRQRESSRPES